MWLNLSQGVKSTLALSDRQSIWPAPDGSDAELIITTKASITEEVLIASQRLVRLKYTLDKVEILMGLNDLPPQPWPDAAAVSGKSFEVMVTDRGAIIVPSHGPRLANRLASWVNILAEDLRSSWSVPPESAAVGATWKLTPAFPGGLPPNTSSADFDVRYELAALKGPAAEVKVTFVIRLMIEAAQRTRSGKGSGEMTVQLDQGRGVQRAVRNGRLEIGATSKRNQLIRSAMELSRL
jgi:hypothetical protein